MKYTTRQVHRFAAVVEAVKHRGLMIREDGSKPDVPKKVSWAGKDWQPCSACLVDAGMMLEAMEHVGLAVVPIVGGTDAAW